MDRIEVLKEISSATERVINQAPKQPRLDAERAALLDAMMKTHRVLSVVTAEGQLLLLTLIGLVIVAGVSGCRTEVKEAGVPESGSTDLNSFLPTSDTDAPLQAWLVPGRTERRALILSGVHGDERGGIEVVERLKVLLERRAAAGHRPFFTTMLVPIVMPRTAQTEQRYVQGGVGLIESDKDQKKRRTVVRQEVEPNLNFPLPGENYGMARRRGAAHPTDAELVIRLPSGAGTVRERPPLGPLTSIRMLPEIRFLVQLIERLQPERLAAIHAHSRESLCHPCRDSQDTACGGEGPGIFMDPRGVDPVSHRVTNASEFQADTRLAHQMVHEGLRRLNRHPLPRTRNGEEAFPPFAGNLACPRPTVLYFSPRRREGNSLGDWAPVPTPGRAGITTLTVEVPKYRRNETPAAHRVINLHRDLLADIFLAAP